MENKTMFEKLLMHRKNLISERIKVINDLKSQILVTQNERTLVRLNRLLKDSERILRHHKNIIEYMRLPKNDKDKVYRRNVGEKFATIIKQTIPDNFPIVFHGTGYIGTVKQIIKSGGLFTPEEKGESPTSFAMLIDVTYKNNIKTSLQFADTTEPYMPYGALFAFSPQDNEIDHVISTGESGEVLNGVNGVNFRNNPDRLYAIITTPENIDRVKKWCADYGWDEEKVFSHNGFVKHIKNFVKTSNHIHKNIETEKIS
jgi:hypothetical protein